VDSPQTFAARLYITRGAFEKAMFVINTRLWTIRGALWINFSRGISGFHKIFSCLLVTFFV
jgi:hypothetical protein